MTSWGKRPCRRYVRLFSFACPITTSRDVHGGVVTAGSSESKSSFKACQNLRMPGGVG